MIEFHEFTADWKYRPDPLRTIVYRAGRKYPLAPGVLRAARADGAIKEPEKNVGSGNRTAPRGSRRAQG